MKKAISTATLFFLLIFATVLLTGCFSVANTTKVMSYSYDNITQIKIFKAATNGFVEFDQTDAKEFYNGARELNFVMNYSQTEENYTYKFVVYFNQNRFVSGVETFYFVGDVFVNSYSKRTQKNVNNSFIEKINEFYQKAYLIKSSEL